MNKKTILILNIICPIVVGALIYYLVSPDVIFVKRIDAVVGSAVNIHISPINNMFFKLVRNYLPDTMWGYALVFALFCIIGNNAVKTEKIFWIAFSFSLAMEMIQMLPLVQGTFDIFDIGVEFLAEIIAAFIINKIYLREEFQDEKENESIASAAVFGAICNNGIRKRLNGFRGNQASYFKRRQRDSRG